jgi:hypothetical protein
VQSPLNFIYADAAVADPNVAFLLLVLGALGVYWEVHAPGMVLPGLLGVLLISTGAYGTYQDSPSWYGLTLLVLAIILLTSSCGITRRLSSTMELLRRTGLPGFQFFRRIHVPNGFAFDSDCVEFSKKLLRFQTARIKRAADPS